MKITVTMEDTADGGVFITFDPSVAVLLDRAARPDQCTAAEGYAFEVLTTIKRVADVAARELGGARPDEGITAMTERIVAENAQLRAELERLASAAESKKHAHTDWVDDDVRARHPKA